MKKTVLTLTLLAVIPALFAAEPKRLLVVGGASGFRHPSIPNGEKMLGQLAAKSNGAYTVTFLGDTPGYPYSRVSTPNPMAGGGGARGGFPAAATGASPAQQTAVTAAGAPLIPYNTIVTLARNALTTASLGTPGPATTAAIKAAADVVATAELMKATAGAEAIAKLQASANRLTPEQLLALSGTAPAAGRGGAAPAGAGRGGSPDDEAALAKAYAQHMSVENLKKYDGVFFVSTVGIQPIPDFEGFMKWVADGHAVMGLHGAMDNGPMPDAYREMFAGGASFAGHPGGGTVARAIYKDDPANPITKDWPASISVVDEFYQFRNLDRSKIHSLIDMDFEGVRHPLVWIKNYGKGRVFYTVMGHRDDVMLPDTPSMDYGNDKENPNEVSVVYQKMVDAGIRWALGLTEVDATPGNVK